MEPEPPQTKDDKAIFRPHNPFNKVEETWLEKQFDLMDSAFSSVNLGEHLMQEMVMFSFGIPLSKNFLVSYLNVFWQRIRAISRTQNFDPESMTDGFMVTLALLVCKVESCHFGIDQLQSCFGYQDNEVWAKSFRDNLMSLQLKKLTLFDMSPEMSVLKGLDTVEEMKKIFRYKLSLQNFFQ